MQIPTNNFQENINKKVAVLLAAYNGKNFLREQLLSILNQRDANIKIFISVDRSTDNTYEFCKNFEKENNSIVVLPYGKIFKSAAKNFFHLIKEVNFEEFNFISLSDQDDIWNENKTYHAICQMQKYRYDGFSSDVITFGVNQKNKYLKKSWPQKKYDFLYESAGPGCTYIFKVEAFKKFKEFLIKNWNSINDLRFHDWIIYAYFRNANLKWKIDNQPFLRYRQHNNNEFGSNSNFYAYKKRFFLIKNKWYRKEVKKIKNLLNIDFKTNYWFRIRNCFKLRRSPKDVVIFFLLSFFGFF